MGVMPIKRPASPLAKGKSKATAKKPAAALEKGKATALEKGKTTALGKGKKVAEDEGPWFSLRKTNARQPKRTYITGCLEAGKGKRRKLVVEVAATWSSQHELICDKIVKALEEKGIKKAEAKKMRAELCQSYP